MVFDDLLSAYSSKKATQEDAEHRDNLLNTSAFLDFLKYADEEGQETSIDYRNVMRRILRIFYDDKGLDCMLRNKEVPVDLIEAITKLLLFMSVTMTGAVSDLQEVRKKYNDLNMDLILYNTPCDIEC